MTSDRFVAIVLAVVALVDLFPKTSHVAAGLPPHVDVATIRHHQMAMDHVKSACTNDVERLCSRKTSASSRSDPSVVLTQPLRISSMVDDMVNTALSAPSSLESPMMTTITFFSLDDNSNNKSPPEIVLDGLLSNFFSQIQNSAPNQPALMNLDDVTKTIMARGHEILAEEKNDEGRIRLARRLSEVDPHQLMKKSNLPFRCSYQNACLHSAYEQGLVSSSCARAIQYLEEIPESYNSAQTEAFADHYRRAMLPMLWIYTLLCVATLLAIRRRYRKQWLTSDKRQLKMRILQAIYSTPHLKSQLEDKLGESLGAVPPLPRRVLEKMSGNGGGSKLRVCFAVKVAFLLSLVLLVFVMPCAVLPICIVAVFGRLCYIAFCMPAVDDGKCVCCCCEGSTEDVQNGTVSAKQACCTCCNGTGVCAVACVSCCGTGDGGCSCCQHGCHCCSDDKDNKSKSNNKSKCVCCCCKGSTEDVRNGTVSAQQACCTCCNGTGVCAVACVSCCGTGDGGCSCCQHGCNCCSDNNKKDDNNDELKVKLIGRGQKHTFVAKEAGIYCGIPVQVV